MTRQRPYRQIVDLGPSDLQAIDPPGALDEIDEQEDPDGMGQTNARNGGPPT